MTALNRAFIEAFRRRAAEPSPQPTEDLDVHDAVDDAPSIALPAIEEPPTPTWQWPPITDQLLRDAAQGFERLAAEIQTPAAGKSPITVAFAGPRRGTGTTSVLLTLARCLSNRGTRPLLLLESNVAQPALDQCLTNPAPQPAAAAEVVDLAGVEIISVDEQGLALANLSGLFDAATPGTVRERLQKFFSGIKDRFPVTVIDAGVVTGAIADDALWTVPAVDVAILVDQTAQDADERNRAVKFLEQHAGQFLGVIETCVPRTARQSDAVRLTG